MKQINEITELPPSNYSYVYLDITFDRLVELLGQPLFIKTDKSWVNWAIIVNETTERTITIYDWKQQLPIKQVTRWNIGCSVELLQDEIINYLSVLRLADYAIKDKSK